MGKARIPGAVALGMSVGFPKKPMEDPEGSQIRRSCLVSLSTALRRGSALFLPLARSWEPSYL